MHAHKGTRKATDSGTQMRVQVARRTQAVGKHTTTQPPSLFPLRQTEPGSAEALTSVFTAEGQCLVRTVRQHILLHTDRSLLSLPNKYVCGGVGGEGGAWEEIEEVGKRQRERK